MLVPGFAFELPLLLVPLNLTGVLTGRRLAGWWHGMVMGIALFSVVAAPTSDPLAMRSPAAPTTLLYVLALGVCPLNDRRRARNDPYAGLDDEASFIGLGPQDVGAAEPADITRRVRAVTGAEPCRSRNRGDGGAPEPPPPGRSHPCRLSLTPPPRTCCSARPAPPTPSPTSR